MYLDANIAGLVVFDEPLQCAVPNKPGLAAMNAIQLMQLARRPAFI
jgi:hypothetical protein